MLIPSLFLPFSRPMSISLTELSNAENVSFKRERPRMSNTDVRLAVCAAVADDDGGECLFAVDDALSWIDDPHSRSSNVFVSADRVSRRLQPLSGSDAFPTPKLLFSSTLAELLDDASGSPSLSLRAPLTCD